MEIRLNREDMLEELAKDIIVGVGVEVVDADKKIVQILRRNSACGTEPIDLKGWLPLEQIKEENIKNYVLGTIFGRLDGINDYKDAFDFCAENCCEDMTITECRDLWYTVKSWYNNLLRMFTALDIEILCNYYKE